MSWLESCQQSLQHGSQAIGDFLFPATCLLCDSPAFGQPWLFCQECEDKIYSNFYRCRKCATPLPEVVPNQDCFRCRKQKWKFDSVITLSPYRKPMDSVIKDMKRPSARLYRRSIGTMLAKAAEAHWLRAFPCASASAQLELLPESGALDKLSLSQESSSPDDSPMLVPVPNFWTHSLFGAADVAGELARQISRINNWELRDDIIRKIRRTEKQGTLAWSERPKNVRDAFQIVEEKALVERHIILVDDVLTSAATGAEIARVLMRSGAKSVTLCVAARGTGTKEVAESIHSATESTKSPTQDQPKRRNQESDSQETAGTS